MSQGKRAESLEEAFTIGKWQVSPNRNQIERGDNSVRLEPRVMDLLVYFAQRQGEVLSREQIFRDVWREADVGESALLTAVSALRRALGDDPRNSRFIETIPKRGYRLIANTTARSAALAVLPFKDLSMHADQPYLADGLGELLVSDLGQVRGIRVISWPSVAGFRGNSPDLREIAEKLNVRYVVDGSVINSGTTLRVSIRLSDASECKRLWSDSYDVKLGDLLNVQRRLANRISSAISGRLRPAPPASLPTTPERSDATVAYLRGRFHWYKASPKHLDRAQEYFEESISIDPSFGPAYAGLADVWGTRGYWGHLPMCAVRDKIWTPLLQAGKLGEEWAEIQMLTGVAYFLLERAWGKGEKHLRRAVGLNPNLAHAHLVYGLFAITLSRGDAGDWIDKAARLDPLNPTIQFARALLSMSHQREQEALKYVERVLELEPLHPPGNQLRSNLAWYLRDTDAIHHEVRLWPRDDEIALVLEKGKRWQPKRTVLLRIGEILQSRAEKQYIQPMQIARNFSLGGDLDTALDVLEKAHASEDLMPIVLLQSDCAWHPLRKHPRFTQLLSDIGIPA